MAKFRADSGTEEAAKRSADYTAEQCPNNSRGNGRFIFCLLTTFARKGGLPDSRAPASCSCRPRSLGAVAGNASRKQVIPMVGSTTRPGA